MNQLQKNKTAQVISYQIIKSSTSVAANYRAACRSRSRAEFISKINIVEEEADETCFWLELLHESKLFPNNNYIKIYNEAKELTAIFTSIGRTTKLNQKKN